ncbi:MAG TPA: glycerol kinase GlpK [Candidatus Limnocylindrales bacterium]
MPEYVGALDQGTTSTRFVIFNRSGAVVAMDQREHSQIYPQPGWVEHDALEIWAKCRDVIAGALTRAGLTGADLAAVGITNQRETTVIWDRHTGRPIHNAIVWQDTRTDSLIADLARGNGPGDPRDPGGSTGPSDPDRFRSKVGLPLATYFSGPKIRWLLDNVPGARDRAEAGDLLFGTIDTWVIWNLTGGAGGTGAAGDAGGGAKPGIHITDVTNAGRTMLMNLHTLDWDVEMLAVMGVPRAILPAIRSSSEVYGEIAAGAGPGPRNGVLDTVAGVPVAGDLGDQHAALFGQTCFAPGEAKNTYGTGCFMLLNTGTAPVESKSGLLTTVGYRIGGEPATYALEGSIAITGALVQWLRDNLGLIRDSAEVETLARTVEDNGGAYFVPAFSGLYAPYWRADARGVIAGLTRYVNRGHIARAVLEATAWQTREVLDAMNADSGVSLTALKVDGGMVHNELLMQFQADVLGVPVIRPKVAETTALGAAYTAGLAVGYWSALDDLRANWSSDREWHPAMDPARREKEFRLWKKAVTKTFDWVE